MKKRWSFILLLLPIILLNSCTPMKPAIHFHWGIIAALRNNDGSASIGVAGAIGGVSNGVFIVAGGSNFLRGMPWNGGSKVYTNQIQVLQRKDSQYNWVGEITDTLPENIAYGGYTSTAKGIVCAGGENGKGLSDKAFLLNWDSLANKIKITPLPDLPAPVTNLALTHRGDTVYAVGGDQGKNTTRGFYSINIGEEHPRWKRLPNLPVPLANCAAVVQHNGQEEFLYVIGGRAKTPSGVSTLHHTTFAFDLKSGLWKRLADISDGKDTLNLSAAAAIGLDGKYIAVFGGDNGIIFHQLEILMAKKAQANNQAQKDSLTEEIKNTDIRHPGFYKGILLYDTQKDQWKKAGQLPFPAHVTTTAVNWDGAVIISNGEIRPGVRTPLIMKGTTDQKVN
jgi:N-acetylneuraminic acid mutarotase